jgi:hypothetical protein
VKAATRFGAISLSPVLVAVRTLISAIVVCFSLCCSSLPQNSERTPTGSDYQQIVMLTEHNPWLMVVGSDSPSFVLYRNGVVIYLKNKVYRTSILSKDEIDALTRQIDLRELERLTDSYSWSDWTDQPDNVIVFQTGDTRKKISVYGNLRPSEPPAQAPAPAKLYFALQTLLNYDAPRSVEWKPDFIEVMVWPFDYAKGKPAIWPSKLPGLSDPNTVRRKNTISLFIPESQSNELSAFLKGLKPTQAVLIDKRKWAISTRWPFPHESQPQPKEKR